MDAVPINSLNAPMGIVIFTLGGLAGAVFYLPFKKVKGWAWESYWMAYAVFGLILVPWLRKTVAEFNFRKGLLLAIFSGLMSSAMSFGLQGGQSMQKAALTIEPRTSVVWAGMPVLAVVLLGGFVVNFVWCLFLNVKNRSAGDYVRKGVPILPNLIFAAIAGAIWCSQFICFKTGEPKMGNTSYIGWAVLMASQIFFSQLLGIAIREWKDTGEKTRRLLATGLSLLVASAVIAGYAGSL